MGVEGNQQTILSNDQKNNTDKKSNPKLTLLPLIALIFYEVSRVPFGVEDSVKSAGGALVSLLGFLIFPIFWSIPEALITAELATSFPENGGYVIWISSAFDPFWGFQEGFSKWFSRVMDNAFYPVLFLDYLKGLHIFGFSVVLLASLSLLPFAVMGILSIPKIRPKRWITLDFKKVQWRGYFNSMFWNLNYWDKASTLASEVENPSRTFLKA
ncbi:probable polyamine transporter At3g19553 [Lactuca sativa]|uniref:probable polyamine transporter At3g19553 n=1 Tax=Lactuca sativa TaxID=4236 RepID=UPI000CD9C479|nr:probable polyamine transporter At3g19553 [Lactuca sativa]